METSWDQLLFLEDSFVVELVKYGVLRGEFPHHRCPVEGTRRSRKSSCGLSSGNSQPWEGWRWWGGDPACAMSADPSRRAAGSCLHLSSPPWLEDSASPLFLALPLCCSELGSEEQGTGRGKLHSHIYDACSWGWNHPRGDKLAIFGTSLP